MIKGETPNLLKKQKEVAQWVESLGDELFRWALHKTNDRLIAQDLVQETFLSAFKGYESFKSESTPKTWLLKILNNKIIDHYRKQARLIVDNHENVPESFDKNDNWRSNGFESAWGEVENNFDDPAFVKTMDTCMNDLPTSWKSALVYKFSSDKKSKDICQELQITPSNYWQILHRSKILLKKCLEMNWFQTQ